MDYSTVMQFQEELIPSLLFITSLGSTKTVAKKAPRVPQHGWGEGHRALGSDWEPGAAHLPTAHAALSELRLLLLWTSEPRQ